MLYSIEIHGFYQTTKKNLKYLETKVTNRFSKFSNKIIKKGSPLMPRPWKCGKTNILPYFFLFEHNFGISNVFFLKTAI